MTLRFGEELPCTLWVASNTRCCWQSSPTIPPRCPVENSAAGNWNAGLPLSIERFRVRTRKAHGGYSTNFDFICHNVRESIG